MNPKIPLSVFSQQERLYSPWFTYGAGEEDEDQREAQEAPGPRSQHGQGNYELLLIYELWRHNLHTFSYIHFTTQIDRMMTIVQSSSRSLRYSLCIYIPARGSNMYIITRLLNTTEKEYLTDQWSCLYIYICWCHSKRAPRTCWTLQLSTSRACRANCR